MSLTPTKNQGSLIWCWRSYGLLSFGCILLYTTVSMGMNINIFCKQFRYVVKIDHHEKLIDIRDLLEQLALYYFSNTFSNDTGTPSKNTPPLDEADEGEPVYTFFAIHFYSSDSPSAATRTISNRTLNSASSISYTLVTSTIGS